MDDTTKNIAKAVFTGQVRTYAAAVAGALIGRHIFPEAQQGQLTDMFFGLAMGGAAAGWSWWNATGHAKVAAYLQKMTGTTTVAAAKDVADAMPAKPPAAVIATAQVVAPQAIAAAATSGPAPKP